MVSFFVHLYYSAAGVILVFCLYLNDPLLVKYMLFAGKISRVWNILGYEIGLSSAKCSRLSLILGYQKLIVYATLGVISFVFL